MAARVTSRKYSLTQRRSAAPPGMDTPAARAADIPHRSARARDVSRLHWWNAVPHSPPIYPRRVCWHTAAALLRRCVAGALPPLLRSSQAPHSVGSGPSLHCAPPRRYSPPLAGNRAPPPGADRRSAVRARCDSLRLSAGRRGWPETTESPTDRRGRHATGREEVGGRTCIGLPQARLTVTPSRPRRAPVAPPSRYIPRQLSRKPSRQPANRAANLITAAAACQDAIWDGREQTAPAPRARCRTAFSCLAGADRSPSGPCGACTGRRCPR